MRARDPRKVRFARVPGGTRSPASTCDIPTLVFLTCALRALLESVAVSWLDCTSWTPGSAMGSQGDGQGGARYGDGDGDGDGHGHGDTDGRRFPQVASLA